MMEKQVIFFPKTLLETSDVTVELFGFAKLMKNVRYYFILPSFEKNANTECKLHRIGHFTRTDCLSCFKQKVTNVLCITEINGILNASLLPRQFDNFVLVIYDPSRLYDYGTLLEYEGDAQKFICFIMLSKWLTSTRHVQKHDHVSEFVDFQMLTNYLLIILNVIISSFGTKLVRLTILRLTLFKHILGMIKNFEWFAQNIIHKEQSLSKSKAINYLMSCICDAVLGITVLYLLNTTFASSNELFSFISNISHVNKFNMNCMYSLHVKLYSQWLL